MSGYTLGISIHRLECMLSDYLHKYVAFLEWTLWCKHCRPRNWVARGALKKHKVSWSFAISWKMNALHYKRLYCVVC